MAKQKIKPIDLSWEKWLVISVLLIVGLGSYFSWFSRKGLQYPSIGIAFVFIAGVLAIHDRQQIKKGLDENFWLSLAMLVVGLVIAVASTNSLRKQMKAPPKLFIFIGMLMMLMGTFMTLMFPVKK